MKKILTAIFLTAIVSIGATGFFFTHTKEIRIPIYFFDRHNNTAPTISQLDFLGQLEGWKQKYEHEVEYASALSQAVKDSAPHKSECVSISEKVLEGKEISLTYDGSLYLLMDHGTISSSTMDFHGGPKDYGMIMLGGTNNTFSGDSMDLNADN